MLKKLSGIAAAAALAATTLAFHAGDASAQAPRPKSDRTFEQGEGRGLPFQVERRGTPNDRFRYYRKGWWYDTPWWTGAVPYEDSSTAAFRVYGEAPARYRYRTDRYRYYRDGYWYDTPAGVLTAPLTLPFAVATAPFRALAGEPIYGRGRHVDWCSARYRSYNPRTNTWVSSRGVVRSCVSPYR
jgi:hypothetical protein